MAKTRTGPNCFYIHPIPWNATLYKDMKRQPLWTVAVSFWIYIFGLLYKENDHTLI